MQAVLRDVGHKLHGGVEDERVDGRHVPRGDLVLARGVALHVHAAHEQHLVDARHEVVVHADEVVGEGVRADALVAGAGQREGDARAAVLSQREEVLRDGQAAVAADGVPRAVPRGLEASERVFPLAAQQLRRVSQHLGHQQLPARGLLEPLVVALHEQAEPGEELREVAQALELG